jgi:class 3 adenylate cyclase
VVTLLFTDLVASTELLARVGDDAAEELRQVHFGLLRTAISSSGGQDVGEVILSGGCDSVGVITV